MAEEKSVRKRVKVYEMTNSGIWTDKGTGHVQCSYNDQLGKYCILVRSEVDGNPVLSSQVQNTEYSRQQETLILWSDMSGLDLALSFQEQKGCEDLWNQIIEIQKRMEADMHGLFRLSRY
jgi:protein phosphatase-4 regulatory subunit 3